MRRVALNFASPTRGSSCFRFKLASIFLLMVPLGFGFVWLRNYLDTRPISWAPYSAGSLKAHLRQGRTVIVAFRADWSFHNQAALEAPEVRRAMRSQNVVAMRADYTNRSPEVGAALRSLGEHTIPVVAVFSGQAPNRPVVLADMITEQEVLEALAR